jgi:uncharacterized protein YcsI (UPF0317 family)
MNDRHAQHLQPLNPLAVRLACREERLSSHTNGLAPGYVQGNLVLLPKAYAFDFLLFCQRNPKPCPLLAVSEAGQWALPAMGQDLDLRSDLPRYRVWESGALIDEPTNIVSYWREDLVGFVLGCSFSFEEALIEAGVSVKHLSCGLNVPMYRTSIATEAAGIFSGPMVVTMRPMRAHDAIRAIQITSELPRVHGAPIHIGDPGLIGIGDLAKPDYGDAVSLEPDEIPVFWACGVTPQSVLLESKPSFCITHAPGCMLVSDWSNRELSLEPRPGIKR